MELMAYAVTVVCDDYRYAYSIDDVGAYVVTLVPFAEEETSGTEYEIVDSVYISLPGDYVVLMDDAYRERAGYAARPGEDAGRRCLRIRQESAAPVRTGASADGRLVYRYR